MTTDVRLLSRQFVAAVNDLCEPAPQFAGELRYSESLLNRLHDGLTAATARGGGRSSASRVPCRVDVLTLVVGIDTITQRWRPELHTVSDRLRKLAEHAWTPDEAALVADYTTQVERWVAEARLLLGDVAPSVPLRKPCPRCSALWNYHRNSGGENVRQYALQATETEVTCHGCRAVWEPHQYGFLAKLLGATTELAEAL